MCYSMTNYFSCQMESKFMIEISCFSALKKSSCLPFGMNNAPGLRLVTVCMYILMVTGAWGFTGREDWKRNCCRKWEGPGWRKGCWRGGCQGVYIVSCPSFGVGLLSKGCEVLLCMYSLWKLFKSWISIGYSVKWQSGWKWSWSISLSELELIHIKYCGFYNLWSCFGILCDGVEGQYFLMSKAFVYGNFVMCRREQQMERVEGLVIRKQRKTEPAQLALAVSPSQMALSQLALHVWNLSFLCPLCMLFALWHQLLNV